MKDPSYDRDDNSPSGDGNASATSSAVWVYGRARDGLCVAGLVIRGSACLPDAGRIAQVWRAIPRRPPSRSRKIRTASASTNSLTSEYGLAVADVRGDLGGASIFKRRDGGPYDQASACSQTFAADAA